MTDPIREFRDYMRSSGFEPPEMIEIYPKITRFGREKAQWCQLFADLGGGTFGDWSKSSKYTWQQATKKRGVKLTTKILQDQQIRQEVIDQAREDAVRHCTAKWEAALPAPDDHPYLVKKGIKANGARITEDGKLMLCAINDEDQISGLQLIDANGTKRMETGSKMDGCYYAIGEIEPNRPVIITEGFATAASIAQAYFPSKVFVVSTFGTSNLLKVAKYYRERLGNVDIIIAGDDDIDKERNAGREAATKAAQEISARLVFPQFKERQNGETDFNDLSQLEGSITVYEQLVMAKEVEVNQEIALSKAVSYPRESVAINEVGTITEAIAKSPTMEERVLINQGTEHSVALAFKNRYINTLKYDHHTGAWFKWTGQYWSIDGTNIVAHYCRDIASESEKKTAERSSFVKGVEAFSKADPAFATTSAAFDMDNYLLNCPDGTYDLRTNERKDHDPNDLISNIAGCAPADGYGFRFKQFLSEVTCGDEALEKFLQISLGSCLSGAIESHWLQFWIGNGRNGKNTLGDAVMRVMGSYARKIPASALMKSKYDGHPTEIANLKGCRLAVASEVDAGAFWSESRVNELTGDATLSARYMRGNFFEFKRTFKFLIYGNHRPRLSSVTPAIQSRLKMVRFNADFSGGEGKSQPDPNLPEKLKAEDGHILRWLMDGHLQWIKNGKKLPPCKAVDLEIADYVENQATPENWMDECLSPQAPLTLSQWTTSSELFKHYTEWKQARNEHPLSQVVWADAMQKRFNKKKRSDGYAYCATILPIVRGI